MSDVEEHKAELVTKLKALSLKKFGSESWPKLFERYDEDHDGAIMRDELAQLLADADVGSDFTRGVWVNGLLANLDKDADEGISFAELSAVIGPKRAPLTREDAAAFARILLATNGQIDTFSFSQAELDLLEEENHKLTEGMDQLGVTAPKKKAKASKTSSGAMQQIVIGVVVALLVAAIMGGGKRRA